MLKDVIYGALGVTSLATKKIKGVVDELILSGEMSKQEGEKIVNSLSEKLKNETHEAEEMVEKIVEKVVDKLNLAKKKDLDNLKEEIDKLKSQCQK